MEDHQKPLNPLSANSAEENATATESAPSVGAIPDPSTVADSSQAEAVSEENSEDLEGRVVEAIQTIFDPEIPVNIYELGLIYSVQPADNGHVDVKMTLTSPHCPVAESLPGEVRDKVESVGGVASASVDVVWDPPWNPDMMSEAAKLELGMF